MKSFRNLLLPISVMFLVSACTERSSELGFPNGWLVGGLNHDYYVMGTDPMVKYDSLMAATIKSSTHVEEGFGTLMQVCSAEKFRGKRVKMSGFLKASQLKGWAGLWMRVDVDNVFVSFDNMHDGKTDRSIKSDTDWKRYDIIADVPHNATKLAFGALLNGDGQIWFDQLTFEEVDNTIETTAISVPNTTAATASLDGIMKIPFNLSFENRGH